MAVKVGESWVSEEAYAYAQARMKESEEKNISIAPNILKEMENDPEKRMEYEALIYDCVKFQEQFAQTAKQRGIKA